MGDRLRAAGANVVFGTFAGKAPVVIWRRKNSDNEDVLLNDFFLPRQFYWNASDASTTVLDDGSESVWDDYYPPGMAEERQRLSFTDVASMLGSSRIPDDIVDVIRNDVKKQQIDELVYSDFADPLRLHYGVKSNAQLSYYMKRIGDLDEDMMKLKNAMASVGKMKAKACTIIMLFDTFAPPLRRAFSNSLEILQQLVVKHAEKHNGVHVRIKGSMLRTVKNLRRIVKVKTDCAGMSFSECLSFNSGVQYRHVIGMHFRNGDRTTFQPGHVDHRNPLEKFVGYLKCAKKLADSLGYDSPLYILATDNSRLKTAVNEWQSGPLLVDEVSINVPIDVIANTVVMPTAPPVHVAQDEEQPTDRMVDTVSEIMLLASSDALMMTRSEFSYVASVFGGRLLGRSWLFTGGKCLQAGTWSTTFWSLFYKANF